MVHGAGTLMAGEELLSTTYVTEARYNGIRLQVILEEAEIPRIKYSKASCYIRQYGRLRHDEFLLQITIKHCCPHRRHRCNTTDLMRTAVDQQSPLQLEKQTQYKISNIYAEDICNRYHMTGCSS
jgi:hypothetical protein